MRQFPDNYRETPSAGTLFPIYVTAICEGRRIGGRSSRFGPLRRAVQDIVGSIDPVGQKWEVFDVQYAGTKRANYANSGCCSLELASLFLYGYDLISIEAQQAHEAVARRSDQHAVVATDTRPHRLMQ